MLGSYICKALYQRGFPFKGLIRKSSNVALLQNIPPEYIISEDMGDVLAMEAILADVDTVIHCAGLVSFDKKDKKELYKTNVGLTTNLVNACLATKVKKIIHISSIAALGRNKKNLLVGEDTKWESSKLNTEYAKSKYLGELEVWRAACEGLCVNILNPSIILAPYHWDRSSARLVKFVKSKFPFYPSGNINYVDLRDVSDAVLMLYESNIKEERFILNAGSMSYKEFFQKVAQRFGTVPPKIQLNRTLAWLGWGLDNFKSLLTGKPSLVTKESIRLSFSKSRYNNEKSYTVLRKGYRSLDDTLDWVCGKEKVTTETSLEMGY